MNKNKVLHKTKTSNLPYQDHMTFNETNVFDLPIGYSEKVSLILTLKETKQGAWIPGEEATIGKCVIGVNSEDVNAANHWREMLIKARIAIVKWQFFR